MNQSKRWADYDRLSSEEQQAAWGLDRPHERPVFRVAEPAPPIPADTSPSASPPVRDRAFLGSAILATVCRQGTQALLGLPDAAYGLLPEPWQTGVRAVFEMGERGEVGPGAISSDLVRAEVLRHGTKVQADAAANAVEQSLAEHMDLACQAGAAHRLAEELADLVGQEESANSGESSQVSRLLGCWRQFTEAELAAEPPLKQFIWEARIPAEDVGSLAAAGGMGKTTLLAGLAVHRALGLPYLGAKVRQGSTVIVSTEDDGDDYRRKLKAWEADLPDFDRATVAKHVHLIDLSGVPLRLIEAVKGSYSSTESVDLLVAAIKERCPAADLIILETVSRLGGDEGNPAMSALVCAAEQLARKTRAAVLLVSHVSKEAARNGIGDAHAARGGGAISDNGRYSLTLTPFEPKKSLPLLGRGVTEDEARGLAVLRVPKLNAAPPQLPVVLRRNSTPWGMTWRVEGPAGKEGRRIDLETRQVDLYVSLRDLARRMAEAGDPLTKSKLSEGLFKQIRGLTKGGISATILEATERGYVHIEVRRGRGGGSIILPGPVAAPETVPAGKSLPAGRDLEIPWESCSEIQLEDEGLTHPPKAERVGEMNSPPLPYSRPFAASHNGWVSSRESSPPYRGLH